MNQTIALFLFVAMMAYSFNGCVADDDKVRSYTNILFIRSPLFKKGLKVSFLLPFSSLVIQSTIYLQVSRKELITLMGQLMDKKPDLIHPFHSIYAAIGEECVWE